MPIIVAGRQRFDVDLVVFDKDGTLLDFDQLWQARTVRWVAAMVELAAGVQAEDLYRAMGFDGRRGRFVPDGPMAVASMNDIYALAAGVLFEHGLDWHESRPLAVQAAANTIAAPPQPEEVQARGDVAGTVRRLRVSGLQVAVATSDERALTEAMLAQMGLDGDVALIVCGDDPFPPKPDPAGLQWLAGQLGTTTARMAMVGDSANDMLTGRNAGVGACIGVEGGAGKRETLARYADVVVGRVGEIVPTR